MGEIRTHAIRVTPERVKKTSVAQNPARGLGSFPGLLLHRSRARKDALCEHHHTTPVQSASRSKNSDMPLLVADAVQTIQASEFRCGNARRAVQKVWFLRLPNGKLKTLTSVQTED